MSDRKTTFLFLSALTFAAAGLVHGASAADQPAKLSVAEGEKFSACMGMKNEDVGHDTGCLAVMKKVNVTQSDMAKMKECEVTQSNTHADVEHDRDCTDMMKKHPEMVRGHGRDDMKVD